MVAKLSRTVEEYTVRSLAELWQSGNAAQLSIVLADIRNGIAGCDFSSNSIKEDIDVLLYLIERSARAASQSMHNTATYQFICCGMAYVLCTQIAVCGDAISYHLKEHANRRASHRAAASFLASYFGVTRQVIASGLHDRECWISYVDKFVSDLAAVAVE